MPNTTYDDDKLLHSDRKGMKWGMHIFGRSRASAFSSRRRRRREGGLSEHERELAVLNLYRNRDRVSTKVLKDKVSRIETEQKLKKLAEAPAIARAEAKKKRLQARLQFAAKVASAGLDVYSKWPNQSVAKRYNPEKQKKELEKALKDFEYRKGMAKAFKDVPLTLTKFDGNVSVDTSKLFQSVNVAGVDVYIPENVRKAKELMKHYAVGGTLDGVYIPSNEETLLQYGKKGMKWKKRKNPLAEAGDHLAEDLVYAVDKKVIDKHVEDAARDKKTVERNMADNISKIKSGVRNGKTIDPSEQKYHDAYMRNAKAYGRVSKVLEARQKHAKEVAAAHAKDVKNRRKK